MLILNAHLAIDGREDYDGDMETIRPLASDDDELPAWCNVLEGMSDEDRDEFRAILSTPVRLTQCEDDAADYGTR
jgi:hypothetical protein